MSPSAVTAANAPILVQLTPGGPPVSMPRWQAQAKGLPAYEPTVASTVAGHAKTYVQVLEKDGSTPIMTDAEAAGRWVAGARRDGRGDGGHPHRDQQRA